MVIKKYSELPAPVKTKIKPPRKIKKKQSYPIFKGIFFGLVFAGLFSAVIFTFATYGTDEPYPLGNTLSPDCTPGAAYCTVVTPASYSFAANNFSGTGNFTTTGTIFTPTLAGGSATTSDLNLKTTSGVGASGADMHFLVGNNGATEAMTILNSGYVGIGTASPGTSLDVNGAIRQELATPSTWEVYNGASFIAKIQVYSTYTDFYASGDGTNPVLALRSGKVGIATTSPTNDLSFAGDAAREIWLERNTTTSGSNLTIQSGGGLSGGTNLNGGSLNLSSGIATGSGSSDMFFQTATPGSSGTTDVTPTTKFTIRGNGNVVVGTGTALATNATGGFLYIPTSAGAPTGVPVIDTIGTMPFEYDTTNHRLYYYRDQWRYIAESGGFQIPNYETADPISGEKIKNGDIVLGMINQTMEDNALHGVWVTWNSVKKQLLAEARGELSQSGAFGNGAVEGVGTETFLDKVKNILFTFGITVKDNAVSIATLATQRFSAETADISKLQMRDEDTGEPYCVSIKAGELIKTKGECGATVGQTSQQFTQTTEQTQQVVSQTQEVVNQAQQVVQEAQQAANNALETTEHAKQAVDEKVQEVVQQAAKTADKTAKDAVSNVKEEIKQEIKQELKQEQSATNNQTPEVQPAPAEQSAPEEQPAQPEQSPPATSGTMIRNAAAGLIKSMWEFTKWIFKTPLEKASKIMPAGVKESSAALMQGANDFIENAINADLKIISSGVKSVLLIKNNIK